MFLTLTQTGLKKSPQTALTDRGHDMSELAPYCTQRPMQFVETRSLTRIQDPARLHEVVDDVRSGVWPVEDSPRDDPLHDVRGRDKVAVRTRREREHLPGGYGERPNVR